MRLLICAGASGGGVYPALAVLRALESEALQVLWVGSLDGMEADLVARAGVPFQAVPAAGVHGVSIKALPANLLQLGRGFLASRRVLAAFRPDVLFFTGGFVAVPVALAGRQTPTVVYVPDIEPGLALRLVARFADKIALTRDASRRYFRDSSNLTVTGYPTRPALMEWDAERGLAHFELDPRLETLLAFGGSKGARSINSAVLGGLQQLLREIQIIHISGELDWPRVQTAQAALPDDLAARYRPYPYLHEEMGGALAAADLVLSRAGASILGEYPLFGLPAILVPYPYAWRYQQVNAQTLVDAGAAVILADTELDNRLVTLVLDLIKDRPRRQAMSNAMRAQASPEAAAEIARLVHFAATGKGNQGSERW